MKSRVGIGHSPRLQWPQKTVGQLSSRALRPALAKKHPRLAYRQLLLRNDVAIILQMELQNAIRAEIVLDELSPVRNHLLRVPPVEH